MSNKKVANYYLRYFAVLFVFAAFIMLIGTLIIKYLIPTAHYPSFLTIVVCEFLITLLAHFLSTWSSERSVQYFGRIYMVLSFFKIILYITLLIGLFTTYKTHLFAIVITFFSNYFIFRIFDLLILFKFFKDKK